MKRITHTEYEPQLEMEKTSPIDKLMIAISFVVIAYVFALALVGGAS